MLEQYDLAAYKGTQNERFRNEIAKDERDSMYCRYQSKQAIYPRGKVYGHCYDSSQKNFYKNNLNGRYEKYRSIFCAKTSNLTLALSTNPSNIIDLIIFSWVLLHFIALLSAFLIPLFALLLGSVSLAGDIVTMLFCYLVVSKSLNFIIWPFIRKKYNLAVIFNRVTGKMAIPTSDAKSLDELPFEEFNAHYKVAHNPNSGFPNRGFTLLHFKKSMRYEKTYANQVAPSLIHWELLQNFMDVTQPLADIPQFEYYREFDKTTAEFDRANGRPKYFWYRVDKSFLKQMNQADDELLKDFNDEEQLDNLLMGKPIKKLTPPDIFKFPWKYADNIKAESEIKFGKTLWQKFTSFLMVDL